MVLKLINYRRWFPLSPLTYVMLLQTDELTWVTRHISVGFGKVGIKMLQFICPKQKRSLCSAFNISGTQTVYRQVAGSRIRCTALQRKESIEYTDQYKTFQGSTQAKWTSILTGFSIFGYAKSERKHRMAWTCVTQYRRIFSGNVTVFDVDSLGWN